MLQKFYIGPYCMSFTAIVNHLKLQRDFPMGTGIQALVDASKFLVEQFLTMQFSCMVNDAKIMENTNIHVIQTRLSQQMCIRPPQSYRQCGQVLSCQAFGHGTAT